jgi:hypothetical protein
MTAPTVPNDEWLYVRDYFLAPSADSILPERPNLTKAFSGWCDPPNNQPIPLLSKGQRTGDSQPPKAHVEEADLSLLLRALLKSYKSGRPCAYDHDSDKVRRIKLTTKDLIIETSLSLSPKVRLVGLNLRRPAFDCESELGESNSPHWFLLQTNVRYVGASMQYIDSIPAIPPAKSSLLFWYSGYNEDGYVLFDNSLIHSARFTWKYH